jgi:hypothetical protein
MKFPTLLFGCAILAIPSTLGKGYVTVYDLWPGDKPCGSGAGEVCLAQDNKTLVNDECQGKTCYFSRFILGAIDPTQVDESDIIWGGEGHKVQVRHLAACGNGRLMIQCNVTITEVTDETVKRETHVDWVMGWGLMSYGNFDIYKIVCRNNTLLE